MAYSVITHKRTAERQLTTLSGRYQASIAAAHREVIRGTMDDLASHRTLALPRRQLLLSIVAATASSCTKFKAIEDEQSNITRFPKYLDRNCRSGTSRIFDECGSQVAIYESALAEANKVGKTLLISYGAEWCIWCHVFDAYITGKSGQFDYRYDKHLVAIHESEDSSTAIESTILNRFVKDSFVLANIEANYARDGGEVLRRSDALQHFTGALPFIYTTNSQGRWAASFDYHKAETRRDGPNWFRGYDRRNLLAELQAMRSAAKST